MAFRLGFDREAIYMKLNSHWKEENVGHGSNYMKVSYWHSKILFDIGVFVTVKTHTHEACNGFLWGSACKPMHISGPEFAHIGEFFNSMALFVTVPLHMFYINLKLVVTRTKFRYNFSPKIGVHTKILKHIYFVFYVSVNIINRIHIVIILCK